MRFSVPMRRLPFDSEMDGMATRYALTLLDEVTSTQDEARSRYRGTPLLVVAGRQKAGRGRSGRRWENAPRAVAASLAFTPDWPRPTWPRLSLAAGLAARDVFGFDLKWPNDLVVGGRKTGGLLAESGEDLVVVGLGVNLWWPEAPSGFGAVCSDDPGAEASAEYAGRWADALLSRADRGPDGWGIEEYRVACLTIGLRVTWKPNGAGRVVTVDDEGRLLVEAHAGLIALTSGEVREVR
ncbi:bifunctional ligase/repressor BirA [bacterium BMS3Abin02]|nr:bifunctional ligase/repressor BirA [bacterium BMS3Abin02]